MILNHGFLLLNKVQQADFGSQLRHLVHANEWVGTFMFEDNAGMEWSNVDWI